MTVQHFSLGAVLTVTDGRLSCDMAEVYAIMNHLTGDNLTTIGLMMRAEACKAEALRQHPQLEGVGMPDEVAKGGTVAISAWLSGAALAFGETLPIEQMCPEDQQHRTIADDITEMTSRGVPVTALLMPDVTSSKT